MGTKWKLKLLPSYDVSPKSVAIISASIITGIALLVMLGTLLIDVTWINVNAILIILPLIFLSSYFIFLLLIEQFIFSKIKLIYKTIHSLKAQKNEKVPIDLSRDYLRQVNRDVIDWANNKQEKIEALQVKEAFRREFIGNLSHELKTPIFSIQGYLLTLLDGGMEDERVNRNFLERANRGVDRMIALVEDLESIAQLEADNIQLNISTFDLTQLARETFESLEIRANDQKVKLKFNKKYEKPIRVKGDMNRIGQVLTNLVANAINYSNSDDAEVEIRFFDMDQHILTEIADNGVGIEASHLPRLFERFYRVEGSRSRHAGGSGLGLCICKSILDAHEENLNVRSTPGVGSTFSFTMKKA